jgi:hypothetical protein
MANRDKQYPGHGEGDGSDRTRCEDETPRDEPVPDDGHATPAQLRHRRMKGAATREIGES